MKTVCVVTGTRADYGLLYWPIVELNKIQNLKVNLVATGSHLSHKHGHTVDAIKQNGLSVDAEIDIGISGDRPDDIARVMGTALNKFSVYFSKNRPDLLLILGDRYEVFAVTQAALLHNIPVAHIHGGEITEGAIDDSIRHAITKLSYLHFASTETYKKRIIQMGESPERVFCTGAPGLDNIKKLTLLSREQLEKELGHRLGKKNILVTFHPVTTSEEQTIVETNNFFNALSSLPIDVSFFVTMPNSDTFSDNVFKVIQEFKNKNSERVHLFTSLGQLKYLSLMKEVDIVAGNSSSGIIEAPFLGKGVLNVGSRQAGRLTSEHVIHVEGSFDSINAGLAILFSNDFKCKLSSLDTIYGDGNASQKIVSIVAQMINKISLKKFYDL